MIIRVFILLYVFLNCRIICRGRVLDSERVIREVSWLSERGLSELQYSADGNLQTFVVQGCPDDFRVVLGPGETEILVQWDEDGTEQEVKIFTGSEEFSNHITTNIDTVYSDPGDGGAPRCSFLVTLEGEPQTFESEEEEYYGESWSSSESYSDWYDSAIYFDYGWSSESTTNWQTISFESETSTSEAQVFSTTDESTRAAGQATVTYNETGTTRLGRTNETSTEIDSIYWETEDSEGKEFMSTAPPFVQRTDQTPTKSFEEDSDFTQSLFTDVFQDVVSDGETVTSMTSLIPTPQVTTSENVFQQPTSESSSDSLDNPLNLTSPVTPLQISLPTSGSYENIEGTFQPTSQIFEESTTGYSKYPDFGEITKPTTDNFNVTEQNQTTEVGTTLGNVSENVTQSSVLAGLYESQSWLCALPDGTFIQVGASTTTSDCQFACSCDETRTLLCVSMGCGKFENCDRRGNRTGCFCQDGFIYDGQGCVKDCPRPFLPFEDRCYYFHNKKMAFAEAAEFCHKMDANLTSIHDERENQFISALVGVKKEVWIGAFRAPSQDPLEIITNGSLQNPEFISQEIPAGIFRIEFSFDPLINAHIFLGPEPKVVTEMYEIVLGSTGDFNLAIRRCPNCANQISWFRSELNQDNSTQEERFYLTFKNNMIEVGKVGAYAPLASYVDMTGDQREIRFIGFASNEVTTTWKFFFDFSWSDGSPWIYENWYLTEPDLFPVDDVMACVFLNYKFNPAWNDDNCNHKRRFVCKQ